MRHRICTLYLVIILVVFMSSAQAAEVTLSSLLKEMYDLERLTYMPDPAYTTKQFSSYDRRSTDPTVQTDENWYANGDRGNHLRVEERNGEKEWVMMDAEGPGAIVRFWSANSDDAGIMRVYLDNSDTPVIEMPLSDYLGGRSEIAPPPIAGMHGTGWNSYLPIPYAKHCKVTCSKPDFYYIINYRTYEAGAKVETYSVEEAGKAESSIIAKGQAISRLEEGLMVSGETEVGGGLTVLPGESRVFVNESDFKTGPGVIKKLTLMIESSEKIEELLRKLLLEITVDNASMPQVQTPLGDFFGTAPGANQYKSLPFDCQKTEHGSYRLVSYWPMPYLKNVVVSLTNTSDIEMKFTVELMVLLGDYTWTDNSLYFHAKWRQELDIPTHPRQDWNFATLQGRGRYVGNMLHISNPVEGWWGEGDEKIYVDGEKFPSWFGTGSEDYYGYAWSSPMLFQHAYHNQTRCDGPGTYGNSSVNRFHILDDIPFNSSFKFDMEIWHWEECVISQSAVSYWYAAPDSTDNFESLAGKELIVPIIAPLPAPEKPPAETIANPTLPDTTSVDLPEASSGGSLDARKAEITLSNFDVRKNLGNSGASELSREVSVTALHNVRDTSKGNIIYTPDPANVLTLSENKLFNIFNNQKMWSEFYEQQKREKNAAYFDSLLEILKMEENWDALDSTEINQLLIQKMSILKLISIMRTSQGANILFDFVEDEKNVLALMQGWGISSNGFFTLESYAHWKCRLRGNAAIASIFSEDERCKNLVITQYENLNKKYKEEKPDSQSWSAFEEDIRENFRDDYYYYGFLVEALACNEYLEHHTYDDAVISIDFHEMFTLISKYDIFIQNMNK